MKRVRRVDFDALELNALDQLWVKEFEQLSKVFVPGEGEFPRAFVFGEAPGAQEEMHRRPFIGPAGKVLRQLMMVADFYAHDPGQSGDAFLRGFTQPNCWLTNTIKFRPPRNRKPYWTEVLAARPFLRAEWVAVGRPRLIIPVGGTALSALIGRQVSIVKHSGWLHKEVSRVDGKPLYVWPMLHPSLGLRNPGMRPLMERDWEALGAWLRAPHP